jgi:eukaryotic-like serine/threonine-protein kinase
MRREPLVVTGTDQGEALGARSVVTHGLRSILAAPLLLDERLLGVVYLDSRVAKGVFTVDDVDLLSAVTHHIAVALETARATRLEVEVATANRQRDLAETLRGAMARFTAILDPEPVLRELLATACASPGADDGWVVLGTAASTSVRVLTRTGGGSRPMSPSLREVLTTGEPRLDEAPGLDLGDSAARLVMPLATRDGPAGALVLSAAARDRWTDIDLGVVAALASQGMVAYENARLFSQVNEMATIDSLTGVANRRRFFELARTAFEASGPLAALMIDIDHFKKINDGYGHQVGDDVIRGVVERLTGVLTSTGAGVLGRYGGEEFALLLPGPADGATGVGEALRAAVADRPVATRGGPVAVTISVGVAVRASAEETPDALLGRADTGLLTAKQGGRNRVVAHRS